MLQLDVFRQMLEDEYDQVAIITMPNVTYKVVMKNGEEISVNNPVEAPDEEKVEYWKESIAGATIITPLEY